ncbi:hypothetical protein DFH09DRAFT_1096680 [Mycena vulgaris]|nr:hypothetical protein DFH09DRAFT_1096680 [Mycena vulgaris]
MISWNPNLTLADADSWCVLDFETTTHDILPPGHVAVSNAFKSNADRLILKNSLADYKHTTRRADEKVHKTQHRPAVDLNTPQAKAKLANRQKELRDIARQKLEDDRAAAEVRAKIRADEEAANAARIAAQNTPNSSSSGAPVLGASGNDLNGDTQMDSA